MATPDPSDVRPALRQAEAKLARHLEEACEDHDRDNIGEESTHELLRLEEELLAAARAVDEAVRLRRKLGHEERPAKPKVAAPELAPPDSGCTKVREFRTASGSEWRVWEVRPALASRARRPGLYPVAYANGWLAFELLNGERRKRLPEFAAEWSTASDKDLELLLERAIDVPQRKRTAPQDQDSNV
jgi:hypothetical protein